jgi:hypothetical protein
MASVPAGGWRIGTPLAGACSTWSKCRLGFVSAIASNKYPADEWACGGPSRSPERPAGNFPPGPPFQSLQLRSSAMRRLRIFISSTMTDLANERHEVAQRLEAMNFEPVFAEALGPDGSGSWDRISTEIASCDLVVLILGERYGWVPDSGPFGSSGLSVTELEYREARRLELPVLPFRKRLDYSGASPSEDAVMRDRFRAEVARWDGGRFLREFELAHDLAEQVAHSVTSLLTDRFLDPTRRLAVTPEDATTGVVSQPPTLPPGLAKAVSAGEVVAFYGAGVSLASGLPSAVAFADAIAGRILELFPDYVAPTSGTYLNAVAADLEALAGREELERTVEAIVSPPWTAEPTLAHRVGGRLFRQIITTNFDNLLEHALSELGDFGLTVPIASDTVEIRRSYRAGETSEDLTDFELIKLHGSLWEPSTLVLTDHDLSNLARTRPQIWSSIVELLRRKSLLVLGSSLRDPSLVALLDSVGPELRGWVVLPTFGDAERARLRRWSLEPIAATADSVVEALDRAVGPP